MVHFRKYSENDHYCNPLYKYAREKTSQFKEHTSSLSTNDKDKIKVDETNYPTAAVTRGKKALVAHQRIAQATDHDFSAITLTPTVVLMNEIPQKVDDSWYRSKPYLFIKITATELSSAIKNAAELKETLLKKWSTVELTPPIVILYTDGGPHTFFCQNCNHCAISFT